MINDYQYLLEMQQKGGEFFKRSLEKQNTISGLSNASNNKLSGVDAKEQWTGELVLNAYIQKQRKRNWMMRYSRLSRVIRNFPF